LQTGYFKIITPSNALFKDPAVFECEVSNKLKSLEYTNTV